MITLTFLLPVNSKIMFRPNLKLIFVFASSLLMFITTGCRDRVKFQSDADPVDIIFLHHSTGHVIWEGDQGFISRIFNKKQVIPDWFDTYNRNNKTNYVVSEQNFPKAQPYGWNNYPYDYYNIWVLNSGKEAYKEEPTLEMLTEEYDLIIFKHCFPVGNIMEDTGNPDPSSPEKRLENYKAQYNLLKEKLNSFPETKFLVWTAVAHVRSNATEAEALRTKEFVEWVINEWDISGDNIYLWDFYSLETEGGLFLKQEYAAKKKDSHPSSVFGQKVAPLFASRIVDVLENNGTKTNLKGEPR